MPSFDVVSNADMQEVKNAVEQVKREMSTRYDLKGAKCTIELEQQNIIITAEEQMTLSALQSILKEKLAKRQVSLKLVVFGEPPKAGGDTLKQSIEIKQGLTADELKLMTKGIKGEKFKVTPQIQGEQLRVSGKKRDDLQTVIGFLKEKYNNLELQFTNFRD